MSDCSPENHRGNYRDRLSELPDEILVRILTFLPLKEAVRTVLLRRFGKLWTLLPKLDLQYCTRKYISNVVSHHKNSTIDSFRIDDYLYKDTSFPIDQHLNECTHFALRKQAKELIVTLNSDRSKYFVPTCVFSSHCLVSLELAGLDIKLPPRVSMGSLQRLVLFCVIVSNEAFSILTSSCPSLKELTVTSPNELEELHFTAPSIERLHLDLSLERFSVAQEQHYSLDCPNLKVLHVEGVFIDNLKVVDVSSVQEAKINCRAISVAGKDTIVDDYFEPLIKKFRSAKVFELDYKSHGQLEPFGSDKWASRKCVSFDLPASLGVDGSSVLGFVRSLRKSRALRELVIYADGDFFYDGDIIVPEISFPYVFRSLTTVTIRGCLKLCQSLLPLIKLLLEKATDLDQLVICCKDKDRLFSLEGSLFISELLSFPRASENAKVVLA